MPDRNVGARRRRAIFARRTIFLSHRFTSILRRVKTCAHLFLLFRFPVGGLGHNFYLLLQNILVKTFFYFFYKQFLFLAIKLFSAHRLTAQVNYLGLATLGYFPIDIQGSCAQIRACD